MTTKEKLEIMTAYLNGMRIQERKVSISDEPWKDTDYEPIWDWDKKEYRIKPEIEDDDPILMTNRQLAKWLADNHGQLVTIHTLDVRTTHIYKYGDDDKFVYGNFLIRHWDSNEWIKPTIDVYKKDYSKIM